MAYDGGDERGLPLWDSNALSLGAPHVMNVPTFIEWLERQLETPEETKNRLARRAARHYEWHQQVGGIWACCIRTGIFTPNEARGLNGRA